MFFGVLPGFAYADEVIVNITNPYTTIPYYASSASSSLTNFNVVYSSSSPSTGMNIPSNYDWESSFFIRLQQPNFSLNRYFRRFQNRLEFPIDFSYDLSGKNFQDFTFSYNPHFRLVYSTQTITNTYWISGDLFVTFSDGTTKQYSYRSFKPEISFGISKKAGSNQYIMTSDDFNLKSNPENGASFSGIPKGEVTDENGNVIDHTVGIFTYKYSQSLLDFVEMTGTGVPDSVFYWTLDVSLASGTTVLTSFAIPAANIVFDKGLVSPSLVTLDKSSSDTVITNIRFSGYIYVSNQVPNISLTPDNVSYSSYVYIIFNTFAYFNSSETVGGDILQRLDDLYYFLRIDLPLQLRHLIIPTQEEVEDVISDAVKNVEDNAGGLGEAVKISNNSFNSVTNAFKNSTASGIYIPSLSIPVSGKIVTLWEDFDFGPYLRSDLVQTILGPAVLILKFAITLFMVRQLMNMWEALMAGCSYIGFLRYQEMDSRDAWLESTDELSAYLGREDWRE